MKDLEIETKHGEITFCKSENDLEICIFKTGADGCGEMSTIYLNESEVNQLLEYLKQTQ